MLRNAGLVYDNQRDANLTRNQISFHRGQRATSLKGWLVDMVLKKARVEGSGKEKVWKRVLWRRKLGTRKLN